jgi:hypothetical protein
VVIALLNLKGTTALVERILRNEPQTRNSDSLLYLRVLQHQAEEKNINLQNIPLPVFLLNMADWGFAPHESVRRARQKAQVKFPELAACEKVTEARIVNEEKYRAFAQGKC